MRRIILMLAVFSVTSFTWGADSAKKGDGKTAPPVLTAEQQKDIKAALDQTNQAQLELLQSQITLQQLAVQAAQVKANMAKIAFNKAIKACGSFTVGQPDPDNPDKFNCVVPQPQPPVATSTEGK